MSIDGKQLRTQSVSTSQLAPGALAASATGRAIMASSFFDNTTTVADKFAAGSIGLDRFQEAVIQADGGQAFTANQSMGGFKLTNVGTPTLSTDAVNKAYVDANTAGLDPKASVRVATAGDLFSNGSINNATLGYSNTGGAQGRGQITFQLPLVGFPFIVDGVTLADGDRILIKDEGLPGGLGADANGIYVCSDLGAGGTSVNCVLDRATDFDEDIEVTAGAYCFTEEGAANADKGFILTTNDPIIIGGASGTSLTFDLFSRLGLGGSTPTTVDAATAASEGTSGSAARADHQHDLTSAAPSVTVKSDASSPSTGTAASVLRTDAQLVAATAAPSSVGTANAQGSSASLARADHVHASPKPTTADKNLSTLSSAGVDAFDTGIDIAATPALDGNVEVRVNGVVYSLADPPTLAKASAAFYFSADGGGTAKAISAITAADSLYFNPLVAGFDLANATDTIDIDYETF